MGRCIGLCIILDRHVAIKNAMSRIWIQPHGYYHYCSHHFVSNFNKRFKDEALKKLLDMICQEPSRWKFVTIYDDMVDKNDQIKEWLEIE